MKKWLLILTIIIVLTLAVAGGLFIYTSLPQRIHDRNISGTFMRNQIWSGEIIVTGDVVVLKDLTVMPGTIVKFAVQDDQDEGYETPADGYNDLDPTRLLNYSKTHSSITVIGKLTAQGTPENKILFTSAAPEPKIADWEAIYPESDGSIIEYSVIEWSRNGISPGEDQPNSIFRNNFINYTMWGPISSWYSSAGIYNNEIYECGHEGIDVQGGKPVVENNTIYNCQVGIVVLRGSALVRNNRIINSGRGNKGTGIHIGGDATPILENNYFEAAPDNSSMKWCYQDFCYGMQGEPSGTPLLTEVYRENEVPRYAVPAYKIENTDYAVELPIEAQEWLFYGWKDEEWKQIEAHINDKILILPKGYSMYVLIPEPTEEERNSEKFNIEHEDIYKIMAV